MKRSAEEALSSSQDDRAAPIWKDLQDLKPKLEEAEKEASLWNKEYKAANALLDDASEQLTVVAGELGDDLVGLLKALASAKAEGDTTEAGLLKAELDATVGDDAAVRKQVRKWQGLRDDKTEAYSNKTAADKKEADLRAEKEELNKQLTPLMYFEGSAWDALAATLPKRGFSSKTPTPSTSTANIANFPRSPLKVVELSHEALLEVFKAEGFVEQLKSVPVTDNLVTRFRVYEEEGVAGAAGDETGVSGYVETDLRVIFSYCTRNAVLEDTPSCFSGRVAKFSLGAMDLQVGCGKQINPKTGRWDAPGELLIVGEVKTDKMSEQHLARTYCDFGCESCTYVVKPKDKGVVGDRHKHNSLVRQLYNYMVSNGLFYGVFSSHTYTAGFIRDCKGNLAITPSLAFDSTAPYTAPQFIVLFYMLARTMQVPESLSKKLGLVLVPCSDTGECSGHKKLPPQCDVTADPGRAKGTDKVAKGDAGNIKQLFFKAADGQHVFASDMVFTEELAPGRTGISRRASLDAADVVVKIADIYKHPELELELTHEGDVYERLRALQGVVIPRLVTYGRFAEDFLCGLATADSGVDATHFDPDATFTDKALLALRMVHELGVLHGDIKRANILRNTAGDPILVDFAMAKVLVGSSPPEDISAMQEEEVQQLKEALST